VAVAWSSNIDSIAGGVVSAWLNEHVPMGITGFAPHPDFLAFAMTIVLSVVCAIGVRESTMMNNILSGVNIVVMLFVIFAGSAYASPANWDTFAPFGVGGIFAGAATSFFSYVGFDVICTSAEEAVRPSRDVPLAIILSLMGCMGIYIGVATVITMIVPYSMVDTNTPLASAFATHAPWATRIIQVGSVCALTTCLMTSVFPMPRIVYAIASDGLLPAWIGAIHPRFSTPAVATMLCGTLAALLALVFDLNALADMLSVGTLISYTLVAASVLALRYREYDQSLTGTGTAGGAADDGKLLLDGLADTDRLLSPHSSDVHDVAPPPCGSTLLPVVAPNGKIWLWGGTFTSYGAATRAMALFITLLLVAWSIVAASQNYPILTGGGTAATAASAAVVGVLVLVALYCAVIIARLPKLEPLNLPFRAPAAPYLPLVSIAINLYLLVSLSPFTWVRFAVWCAIGTAIYLGYGIKHSHARVEATSDLADTPAQSRNASVSDASDGGPFRPGMAAALGQNGWTRGGAR